MELNVEKWPALWRPASAKTAPAVRLLERELSLPDGTRGTSKLEIGYTQLGTTTTEDQKMFYALIRNWEENGKPADRPVFFSDRLLARLLKKKGWGTNVIEAITASLRRLRLTPLRWINSYHRRDNSGKSVETEIPFQFLSNLKIVTRRQDGHVTNQQGYYEFDPNILQNLLANYTKPLLDEEFFSLHTEIGQLLYTHLDLIMFDKSRYERCTKDLFLDLGLLDNPSYRYPSNRKQALTRPLAELAGKRLSRGVLSSLAIERTKDGKDYKLVAVKGRVQQKDDDSSERLQAPEATVVINHYAKAKDPLAVQAGEIVQHFHRLVHGVKTHEAQSRELSQAVALVSQYGPEKTRHIIGYAAGKAAETKFPMQHFGAVLSYASRGAADFESLERQKMAPHAVRPKAGFQEQRGEVRLSRGQSRLAALTEAQLAVRLGQTKAALLAEVPFLARSPQDGKGLLSDMVTRRLIRQLEHEPMDLLVLPG